jgi:hypothetical protein
VLPFQDGSTLSSLAQEHQPRSWEGLELEPLAGLPELEALGPVEPELEPEGQALVLAALVLAALVLAALVLAALVLAASCQGSRT